MPDEPRLLEIGRIDRSHGLGGDVLVRLISNHDERLAPGSVLDADGVPLTVVSAWPHQGRFRVSFEGLASKEDADAVAGSVLRAAAVEGDPDGYWIHDLIGALVVDGAGVDHGTVVEVLENPASDLLVLSTGPLVPLRFATWLGEGRLVVDGPAGLLDGT